VSAPRVDIDLAKIEHNTRALVDRLSPVGVRVVGITKATLGKSEIGTAMLRGGAVGLGDSRVANLARLSGLAGSTSRTLIRSPMLSEARDVVRTATCSLNTEATALERLNEAAHQERRIHDVVLMVELGDLREGIATEDVAEAARVVLGYPALRLVGLGTNLACQNGVVPTNTNMDVLTRLVTDIESAHNISLDRVSGGNSATLEWALTTSDVGRTNELRLGEAILLGLDPLNRSPLPGLHLDAFRLSAEVIEVATKPAQPWGSRAQTAFGDPPPRTGSGTVRQAILAIGRQDVDHDGLQPPEGMAILGASSDHLVVEVGDHAVRVGDELAFGLGYGALVRAMTSPFVTQQILAADAGRTAALGR
jgi:predicted amino acid racemase